MDKEIEMMLPEYINGTLSPENKEIVERLMQEDMDIKAEVEFLQCLQDAVKNQEIESPADWGWARLKRSLPAVKDNSIDNTSSWWKPLAVAASFAFILQTSYMLFNENKIDEGYVPLSTSEIENTIQIVFVPTITEEQLRNLMLNAQANIVSGPSASGVYRIVAKDRDRAIDLLKENQLVEHVEQEE